MIAKSLHVSGQTATWVSESKMNALLGVDKAGHWRNSGRLTPHVDSLTKSTSPKFIEWPSIVDWNMMTDADIIQWMIQIEPEATDTELRANM